MSKPIVAIVGRPNVGKSTLFNVLAGDTISIVKDTPGVTRDRIYADCTWLDMNFTLIDTGGIEPDSRDVILSQMREQAEIAISTADVIIFIVDVRQGLVDADSKVADMLRRSKKPVVLAVNKVDSFAKFGNDVYEFYNLGIGEPIPISAASRLGLGELLMAFSHDIFMLLAGNVIAGAAFSILTTSVFHRSAEYFPPRLSDRATSAILVGCNLGSGLASYVLYLIDQINGQMYMSFLVFGVLFISIGALTYFRLIFTSKVK